MDNHATILSNATTGARHSESGAARVARTSPRGSRSASSYLEVLVAMVVFTLGVSGLVPLAVVNTRQVRAIGARMPADEIQYMVPPDNLWAAKLVAPAAVSDAAPPPKSPVVHLIDDGNTGYTQENQGGSDWYSFPGTSAYGGDFCIDYADSAGDKAIWTFAGLVPCRFDVFVTYPPDLLSRASNAPYRICDDATELGLRIVDQRTTPSGPIYNGVAWESLGTFVIQSGVLRVELSDLGTDNWVAADAVRIVPIKNTVEILAVAVLPEHASMTVSVSVTVP